MVYSLSTLLTSAATAAALGLLIGFSFSSRTFTQGQSHHKRGRRCRLPKRMILVRHGQSEGNIDPRLYSSRPDNAMHLTELGYEQARAAGKSIQRIIGDESVRFIVSPYVRTIETMKGIWKAWGPAGVHLPWSEEPRIREQDFGNFQEPMKIRECKQQRRRFGSFFYRFPSGESPADVYDRISSFLESLYRMFDKTSEENFVIVTHGVAIRVILTRYFKYSVRDFEQLENFSNGEFVVLERQGNLNKYKLKKVIRNTVVMNCETKEVVSVQTEEAKALRVQSKPTVPLPYQTSPVNHFRKPPPAFEESDEECNQFSPEGESEEMDCFSIDSEEGDIDSLPIMVKPVPK